MRIAITATIGIYAADNNRMNLFQTSTSVKIRTKSNNK